MQQGHKRSHWIWYIFPNLKGLGHSPTSVKYGIPSIAMATSYLEHPQLRKNLLEITDVVHNQIVVNKVQVDELMGSDVDAQKLVSSLTLFSPVAKRLKERKPDLEKPLGEFVKQAEETLNEIQRTSNMPRCAFTLQALKKYFLQENSKTDL